MFMARKKKIPNKEKEKAAKPRKRTRKQIKKPGERGRSQMPKPVDVSDWNPKTELGSKVKQREIINIDEILDNSLRILEPEIVDSLLDLEQDLLLIGQSKGKFGGGSRRVFRQTQKKTREGNKPKFSTMAVVGYKNGHIGMGFGKAKETVPAREKAIRKAKLNIFKIRRGCGSWECGCATPHSIPFKVTGKCGSVIVEFMPAPKGKGLCAEKEIAKIFALSGIKDVWTKTRGQTKNKVNFIYACEDALKKLVKTKVKPDQIETFAIAEGSLAVEKEEKQEKEEKKGAEMQPGADAEKPDAKPDTDAKTEVKDEN